MKTLIEKLIRRTVAVAITRNHLHLDPDEVSDDILTNVASRGDMGCLIGMLLDKEK